jgi:TonB-linked SusC/RagA family outer membrane protein
MKRFLLLAIFASATYGVFAQERVISGKVSSKEDGSPLPGVNVQVKGTTVGTATDGDGNYRLNIPSGGEILTFSFIGYKTVEEPIGARTAIDVSLESDATQLSEVVVVGYGTQLKQDLTGNIAKVSGADISNIPVPSIDQAIQGRAAGVFVEAGNGKLGQAIKVRVRGAASVSGSNEPLYVVDGVIITNDNLSSTAAATSPLANINFNDVESIDILKDASAAAIYGSRAANGVVLITTKKGKSGGTKFNIGYQKGFSSPTRTANWLNGEQYYQAFKEAYDNTEVILQDAGYINFGDWYDGDPSLTYDDILDFELGYWERDANENWADLAYRDDAGIDQLDFSASGGTDKTKFFTSFQLLDQKGILIQDALQRISARVNIENQASEKFTFGVNFMASRTLNSRLSSDNAFTTPMQLLALPPIQPARLADGTLNEQTVYFNGLIKKENSYFNTSTFRSISNLFGRYQITKDLAFTSEVASDVLIQNEDTWDGKAVDSQTGNRNGGGFSSWTNVQNYSTNNYFSFVKQLSENHNLDATVGMSLQVAQRDITSASAQTFPNDAYKTLASASVVTAAPSFRTNFSFLSYFARANYKFSNKYLVTLSGRIDGSSKFGEDKRYGFFPAASVGWIVSNESFLSSISQISFLKVRGSVGLTGNAPFGNFAGLGLYGANTYDVVGGQAPVQLENPNLKWETTLQTNIGLDFGILNDRITGEFDYYVKNTDDVLLNSNVPGTSGFLTRFINIGEIENRGFEFVINTRNIVGDFSWTTSFNFGRNRNKIVDLDGNIIEAGFINRAVEGQPIGAFFAQEYAGVNPDNGDALWYLNRQPTQDEIDNGLAFFVDKFGDRYVTNDHASANRTIVGDPNPDFIGGINNTLSYKGFDLSFLFQFVYGNDVYNGGGRFQRADFVYFDNHLVEDYERAWRNPGDQTDVPQARLFIGNGDFVSSRYIQDASYVRLKTVTLGYNLPASVISRFKFNSVRLFASGLNLLTFTKYDLNDPEVNTDFTAGNIGQGNDFYAAPQAKTITFGINIGF